MATDALSQEQKDFLEQCEAELKERFTDKDEEFMAVFSAAAPEPPVVDPWHVAGQRRNHRADRRQQRHDHPFRREPGSGARDNGPQRGYRDDGPQRGYRDDGYERPQGGGYQRRERRPY